ncbi:MAG: putative transcriptional regulator [Hyphomicrobiaceae bacterium]|jgi:putative transcriptional regulator
MASEILVAPGLLIAMPQLGDPNFARCVVLMVEHQREGSFGLVLNRPSQASVVDLLRGIEVDWRGSDSDIAWEGGPVQPDTGWILHEPIPGLESSGTHEIVPGLFLSSAPDALGTVAAHPPGRVRFLLGYSGWGPAQLETELSESAWVNSEVDADFVFQTKPEEMWAASLKRLGVEPSSLAPANGVH